MSRPKTESQAIAALWRNRARHINMRGRMHGAEGHLYPDDLREIVHRDGSRCIYCKLALDFLRPGNDNSEGKAAATFDHIIRLCDGGSNSLENVVCSCRGCNQRNAKQSIEDPEGEAIRRLRVFLARKVARESSLRRAAA